MSLIHRLLNSENFPLSHTEVISLCIAARASFLNQPMLLEIKAPLNICGEFTKRER